MAQGSIAVHAGHVGPRISSLSGKVHHVYCCCFPAQIPTQRSRLWGAQQQQLWQLTTMRHSRGTQQLSRRRHGQVVNAFLPVDPWAPGSAIDSQSVASSLFAVSLFPYLGFLYHLTKSKTAPPLTLFGFYFLLAFVGATIPAGIYAKLQYGTSLSNVDWLHGGAESLLTITNLLIVFGLRKALRNREESPKEGAADPIAGEDVEQEERQLPLSK